MGACDACDPPERGKAVNNEKLIKTSQFEQVDQSFTYVSKSICKITIKNLNASGFLLKYSIDNKYFYCLVSNEHAITQDMITKKEIIYVHYDHESKNFDIKLDDKERYINIFQKNYKMDIAVVEILSKDNVHDAYFLSPESDINVNNASQLKNYQIFIPQYPLGQGLTYAYGTIKEINGNDITHLANTLKGSSGSPIFLKNSTKVIGIHEGSSRVEDANVGVLLYPVLNILKNDINLKERLKKIEMENKTNFGKITKDPLEDKKNLDINTSTNRFIVGDGKYIFPNGDYYIGDFLKGIRHGKGKEYYQNNTLKYDGDFVNGKYEGHGTFIWEDGEYYTGQWLNSARHGKGKEYYKNKTLRYEGDYVNNKYEGNGKLIYENGDYYIGQWLNGLRHGKGKLFYKNNNLIYDGDYVNDKKEGNGKYIDTNGMCYIGQWLNDCRQGKGKIFDKNNNLIYEGDFVKDKFEGNGKYICSNGDYYIGQFLNDVRHGKGKEYNKNNTLKFEGYFVNGKLKNN